MLDDNHYNIYENLKDDFEVYGDILDVGCGEELKNILDFVDSPFQSLKGIDKKPLADPTLLDIDILKIKGKDQGCSILKNKKGSKQRRCG